jgi:hypothetical protein
MGLHNSIKFRDLSIHRKEMEFELTIYRKPTQTDIIIFNDSSYPHEYKILSINYSVNRLNTYPISKEVKEKELHFITNALHSNKYNINKIVKHPVPQKQNTDTDLQRRCFNIPRDCGRCYIGETSRPLEVRINEHKYNLTQGLLEKSKSVLHAYQEYYKNFGKKRFLQTEPNTTCRKHQEPAHMSLIDHPISQPSLDTSPIWTPVIAAKIKKTAAPSGVYLMGKECFYVGTIQRLCLFSDDICSDSTMVL